MKCFGRPEAHSRPPRPPQGTRKSKRGDVILVSWGTPGAQTSRQGYMLGRLLGHLGEAQFLFEFWLILALPTLRMYYVWHQTSSVSPFHTGHGNISWSEELGDLGIPRRPLSAFPAILLLPPPSAITLSSLPPITYQTLHLPLNPTPKE